MADFSGKTAGGLSGQALRQVLRAADICVLVQNTDLRYQTAENLPPALQEKWRRGCAEEELFPAEFAAQMRRLKQRLLQAEQAGAALAEPPPELILPLKCAAAAEIEAEIGAEAEAEDAPPRQEQAQASAQAEAAKAQAEEAEAGESAEYRVMRYLNAAPRRAGGSPRDLWLKFTVSPLRDDSGRLTGFVSTGANIAELRAREELLQALLREVSHRSKNLLAIIQSIAAQTARFSRSTAVFLKKFQGRLHSLSSSQDLVTESDWRGARLRDLVYAQTYFYAEAAAAAQQQGCEITCRGQNPYLFPSAALHIGLALHELVINSAAFGALARGSGSIKIYCEKRKAAASGRGGAAAELMRLSWRESFPPEGGALAAEQKTEGEAAAAPDISAHFGRAVLERIVPAAVNGEASYSINNGYIEYDIDIPSENYSKKEEKSEFIYHI